MTSNAREAAEEINQIIIDAVNEPSRKGYPIGNEETMWSKIEPIIQQAIDARVLKLEAAIHKHVKRECLKCPSWVKDLEFCPSPGCGIHILWRAANALKKGSD